MRIYGAISKVEEQADGTLVVCGYASSEVVDADGEVIKAEAIKAALPEFFKYGGTGPLREMHQNIAAGIVEHAEMMEDGKTFISARVVDPVSVKKVQAGVLKGFSVGGKKLPGGYDPVTKIISKMRLTEISLVDRPNNPEAVITVWKGEDMNADEKAAEEAAKKKAEEEAAAGKKEGAVAKTEITEHKAEVASSEEAAVDELAKMLNSSTITPTALVALAKTDIANADIRKVQQEKISKGIYTASQALMLCEQLKMLADSTKFEAEQENDGSAIPEQLKKLCQAFGAVVKDMVAEEVDELTEYEEVADMVAMAIQTGDIAKVYLVPKGLKAKGALAKRLAVAKPEELEGMLKEAGAQIAKAKAHDTKINVTNLQAIHDHCHVMGATCEVAAPVIEKALNDPSRTASSEAIEKALGETREELKKVTTTNEDLQKRLKAIEDQPAPARAVLKLVTVEKSHDNSKPEKDKEVEVTPVLKADGTVDEAATAIKKVHQTGGTLQIRK